MNKEIILKYRWHRLGGGRIKPTHQKYLEKEALDKLARMFGTGCVEGELSMNILLNNFDTRHGIDYRGSWKIVKA